MRGTGVGSPQMDHSRGAKALKVKIYE